MKRTISRIQDNHEQNNCSVKLISRQEYVYANKKGQESVNDDEIQHI